MLRRHTLRRIQPTLAIRMFLVNAFVCIYVVYAHNILSILVTSKYFYCNGTIGISCVHNFVCSWYHENAILLYAACAHILRS